MNIFRKYTRKSLANNRIRTLVTIIGIILSVSLFTAVVEGFVSAREYAIRIVKATVGAYEAAYNDCDDEMLDIINKDDRIQTIQTIQDIGYGEIGSCNTDKPYLYVGAVGNNFTDMVAVKLTEGRMPKNSNEIILPKHLWTDGAVEYKVDDMLNIEVGNRMLNGEKLSKDTEYTDGEELNGLNPLSYKVVGIYERLDYGVESYRCPGYTALTILDNNAGKTDRDFTGSVYFNMKSQKQLNELMKDYDAYCKHFSNNNVNREILAYSGITNDNGLWRAMYALIIILFALIMFGSIALIYNSFSISFSERTKQFGILKSIGATRKQIIGTVVYEAVMLCLIAIPVGIIVGCTGIGITLYSLRDSFTFIFADRNNGGVLMNLHIEPMALVIAAVLGLITTMISAMIPAAHAVKISAIDAVRQSNDMKITGRRIKTSKLTRRLFGLSGMLAAKNFKRSKRKYRATVISLFVSVVLFISASSFVNYLTHSIDVVAADADYDVKYEISDEINLSYDYDEMYKRIQSINGITDSAMVIENHVDFNINESMLSDNYKEMYGQEFTGDPDDPEYAENKYIFEKNKSIISLSMIFVDDKTYNETLKNNNIKQGKTLKDCNYGLLYDNSLNVEHKEDGDVRKFMPIFERSNTPFTINAIRVKPIEGYRYNYSEPVNDGDGVVRKEEYVYIPDDITSDSDNNNLRVSEEEAIETEPVIIGAAIDKPPFFSKYDTFIMFPESSMSKFMINDSTYINFYIKTDEHNYVSNEVAGVANNKNNEIHGYVQDREAERESTRSVMLIINVFSYGFIILISLIAIANIFNTISTNILLRRREFAMLKSVGMSNKGSMRMMNYECILYGVKGLIYGIPVAIIITYLIYRGVGGGIPTEFYIPWYSIAISVGSVFVVVFATMIYSMNKIKKDNPIDALKDENM